MKKRNIVLLLIIASALYAFEYSKWSGNINDSSPKCRSAIIKQAEVFDVNTQLSKGFQLDFSDPFIYKIDSRFIVRITKEDLNSAISILDIFPNEATFDKTSFTNVEIGLVESEVENIARGNSEFLNQKQKKLISTMDYSDNFFVRADYQLKNGKEPKHNNRYIIYYISIVPTVSAQHSKGNDFLIESIRNATKIERVQATNGQLKPGKIRYTITAGGNVKNVSIESTCGHEILDHKIAKLISIENKNWIPAKNYNGTPVDEELVFFFGVQGC